MSDQGSMLLISLGPIQDFIRSARRCQDLWFGSWLLSDLARTVGEEVQRAGASVIFPAGLAASEAQGGERPGVANLIFVTLSAGTDPGVIAEQARVRMLEELYRIADGAFQSIQGNEDARRRVHLDVARSQLAELMEFMWVAVPYDGQPTHYEQTRKELYRRLAALKNTRLWQQPSWTQLAGAGVPKSSLDGERESVIDESVYARQGGVPPHLRRRWFGVKGAERLCGVGLLKRRGQELGASAFRGGKPRFHSTSHIAAVPTLLQIEKHPTGQREVDTFLRALSGLGLDLDRFRVERSTDGPPTLSGSDGVGYDGVLLFPSRMEDHFSEVSPPLHVTEQQARAKDGGKALRRLFKELDLPPEPDPYYVYLLADGDNVGASIDAAKAPELHRALAADLNAFAEGCRGIVGEHRGTLIFSGGDDVLALLPMHTALACARELAKMFQKCMAKYGFERDKVRVAPSLSVGLAVSHAREPMSEARKLAERAEKAAKGHPGKNALCVLVSKRSGGDLIVTGGWGDLSKDGVAEDVAEQSLDQRLGHWLDVLEKGELSTRTAHELEEIAAHYGTLSHKEQEERLNEIRALCWQVLARKRKTGGDGKADDRHIQAILALLGVGEMSVVGRVRRMSEELQIARAFYRAQRGEG